jgi:hypothetical protein
MFLFLLHFLSQSRVLLGKGLSFLGDLAAVKLFMA